MSPRTKIRLLQEHIARLEKKLEAQNHKLFWRGVELGGLRASLSRPNPEVEFLRKMEPITEAIQ